MNMFVVNLNILAQANDFRIERRQIVFLCSMQDSNQGLWKRIASKLNSHPQTDGAIEDQAKGLWSASIQPTWPHCRLAFAPGSADLHVCWFLCSSTGKRFDAVYNHAIWQCFVVIKTIYNDKRANMIKHTLGYHYYIPYFYVCNYTYPCSKLDISRAILFNKKVNETRVFVVALCGIVHYIS